MKTIDYYRALKQQLGNCTDYRLAKVLGVSQTTVYTWRDQEAAFSDPVAIHVAELLGLPIPQLLTDMSAERSRDDRVRMEWEKISHRFLSPLKRGKALISRGNLVAA